MQTTDPSFREGARLGIKTFLDQEKTRKNLVMSPKAELDTRTYWSTDSRTQIKPQKKKHRSLSEADGVTNTNTTFYSM
jgi:hypothetical protein